LTSRGFTEDHVEEIYDIRKSLELQALRSSAQYLSIQGLKKLRAEVREVAGCADCQRHQEVDARLHGYFIEGSRKKRLIAILKQMFRLIQGFRELGFRDPEVGDTASQAHLALIDALSVRDLAGAERILLAHIEESKRNAISPTVRGA
jgi:DNA-binding GntR family transcriptional regulator